MSVLLVCRSMVYRGWSHDPAYVNFVIQNSHSFAHLSGWEQRRIIDQLLSRYNAKTVLFNFNRVTVEFDSQEDLTQFVLTWS
jgi:hypothetical protein